MVSGCAVSVNSKKADHNDSLGARFSASIDRFTQGASDKQLLVGVSGGVDSVALLSLAADWQQHPQRSVRAVYIDHGLQSQSEQWLQHCQQLCENLSVEFHTRQVKVNLNTGLSPEAAARDARYDALLQMIKQGEYLCTGHHANDQAETLLLQLLRGAGVSGLAAMPACREFGQGFLARPLLNITRDEILHYAKSKALQWCEDPSNQSLGYDRNYIRHKVLPVIEQRWPSVANSLSRSAAHCAEADVLLKELAAVDLADNRLGAREGNKEGNRAEEHLSKDPSDADRFDNHQQISVSKLHSLSLPRCKNSLRHWIAASGYLPPSQAQLQQIVDGLVNASDDSHGLVNFGSAQVTRYNNQLYIGVRGSFEQAPDFEYQWSNREQPLVIAEAGWTLRTGSHPALQSTTVETLTVRNRRGGERLRSDGAAHSVSVKSLLQQKRVPPWQRSRLALVYEGETLLCICGPGLEG